MAKFCALKSTDILRFHAAGLVSRFNSVTFSSSEVDLSLLAFFGRSESHRSEVLPERCHISTQCDGYALEPPIVAVDLCRQIL